MIKSRKSRQPNLSKIDVHALLRQRRQIGFIWSIEDVQTIRIDLTDDQAWKVLSECERTHDCEIGINWSTIECIADMLFPDPSGTTSDADNA
jgi:hypothetical protein